MKEYFGTLVATTLLGGIVRMLAPEGNTQKYLRLTVSLCLAMAILAPLLGAIAEERAFSIGDLLSEEANVDLNYDEIYDSSLQNATKLQAEEIIQTKIYQRFSLNEETALVNVKFVTENDKIELSEICVSLRGSAVLLEPREIEAFVCDAWNCPCVILYE